MTSISRCMQTGTGRLVTVIDFCQADVTWACGYAEVQR